VVLVLLRRMTLLVALSVREQHRRTRTVVERIPDSWCRLTSGGTVCKHMVSNGSL
jgi:hypothetical protein